MIFKESKNKLAQLLLGALFLISIGLWGAVLGGHFASNEALYFFSVGQGDSSFIQLASGAQILIDGGPSGKALLENLSKVMSAQDRYIDLMVMTHPQLDHFGGFISLLKNYEIGTFISSGRKGEISAYYELSSLLEKMKVPRLVLGEGDSITVGDDNLSILAPTQTGILSGELNDTALVVLLETAKIKALYTADIDSHTEEELIAKYDLDVDVLKVAHHGSRFSSSEKFLQKISPAVAVIEVGKNTYGHPTKAALDRLGKFTQEIFRTDKQGIVKVIGEANSLKIFSSR